MRRALARLLILVMSLQWPGSSAASIPHFNSATFTNASASLSAGRNLTASVTGTLANNAALITAGNDLTLSAATFQNLAAQDSYEGWAFAGGGGHDLGING